jgi:hypothetical protein
MKAKTILKELSKFRASDVIYDINQNFAVTAGVKHLCEHAKGGWILQLYVIVLNSLNKPSAGSKTFLKMFANDGVATLNVTDEDNQQIDNYDVKLETEFLLDTVRLESVFDGQRFLILLPNER